jgi:hypothetical protein
MYMMFEAVLAEVLVKCCFTIGCLSNLRDLFRKTVDNLIKESV